MLENWLRPIPATLAKALELDKGSFGSHIQRHESKLPALKSTKIALIGIGDVEADAVREHLYPLSFNFKGLEIADLGNVRKAENSFIIPLIQELLDGKICPLIIGQEGKFLHSQFEAHHATQSNVSLAIVDEKIPFHPKSGEIRGNYLNPIIQNKARLFHFTAIGCQSHFVEETVFEELDAKGFDVVRLGKARANLSETEPFIRDADLVSFQLNVLKNMEAPGVVNSTPSGFFTEEACQICRYAGMSDKLSSIGFYGYQENLDSQRTTAKTLAQMIWYFIEGFYNRRGDFPASMEGLTEYIVASKTHDFQLTFWKSNKTGRWWLQVPVKTKKKHQRHRLIACSYNDYLQAGKDELPPRLSKAFDRFQ